jgi:hypothetical protein
VELVELQRIGSELSSLRDDVAFVCVNLRDPPEIVRKRWEQKKLTLLATLQEFARASEAFAVNGYPSNFVVGPDGRLLYRAAGWDREAVLGALDSARGAPRDDAERTEVERRAQARRTLRELRDAVEEFQRSRGRLPRTLDELIQPDTDDGSPALLAALPLDPWGRAFAASFEEGAWNIATLGRDGEPGGIGLDADIDSRWL